MDFESTGFFVFWGDYMGGGINWIVRGLYLCWGSLWRHKYSEKEFSFMPEQ